MTLALFSSFVLLVAAQDAVQTETGPKTRPERTGWQETSTVLDVHEFLDQLKELPHATRLRRSSEGGTAQGRVLPTVRVRLGGQPAPLRALIIANIHGGEVEGKEATQILLREFALGQHEDLLQHVDLLVLPVFNADGNDEIDRGNRVEQNGPDGGVGRRHNSQDRDLNRDFIKAESPEVRTLLHILTEFEPHLFMDLHSTNGSYHGYHLTYCTSLNGNTDDALATLMHERFIPSVRKRMLDGHGYRVFDYGNFGRGGPESGWTTFSSDPRLAINYFGLRHCLSLLSEAYSYLPLEERAKVTRAFVLDSLAELVARKDEILKLRAEAEARATTLPFRFAHELAPPVIGELLVGAVEEKAIAGFGKRRMVKPEFEAVQAPIRTRFVAKREIALPKAWAIVGDFPLAAHIVREHGIDVFTLREKISVAAAAFAVTELSRQRAMFEGHRLVKLGGTWSQAERELPAGSFIVPAEHKLARLAAQLLEAQSDDSLATWGFFDGGISRVDETGEGKLSYPVLRLDAMPHTAALARPAYHDSIFPRLVPYLSLFELGILDLSRQAQFPDKTWPSTIVIMVEVEKAGERALPRGVEEDPRFAGRELSYKLGDTRLNALADPEG